MSDVIKFPRGPSPNASMAERLRAQRIALSELSPEAIGVAKAAMRMTIKAQIVAARDQFADDQWVRALLLEILETIPS